MGSLMKSKFDPDSDKIVKSRRVCECDCVCRRTHREVLQCGYRQTHQKLAETSSSEERRGGTESGGGSRGVTFETFALLKQSLTNNFQNHTLTWRSCLSQDTCDQRSQMTTGPCETQPEEFSPNSGTVGDVHGMLMVSDKMVYDGTGGRCPTISWRAGWFHLGIML